MIDEEILKALEILDSQYYFIDTVSPEYREVQKAYYKGLWMMLDQFLPLNYSLFRDENGKHYVEDNSVKF